MLRVCDAPAPRRVTGATAMLLTCGRAVGGTAVAVAGYSLTGLAATIVLGRRPTWLAPLGLGASAAGFVPMVALI